MLLNWWMVRRKSWIEKTLDDEFESARLSSLAHHLTVEKYLDTTKATW